MRKDRQEGERRRGEGVNQIFELRHRLSVTPLRKGRGRKDQEDQNEPKPRDCIREIPVIKGRQFTKEKKWGDNACIMEFDIGG